MKTYLFAVLLFLGFYTLQAQQKVTVKMPVSDTSKYVTLAHYHGYKQFLKVDSAKVKDGVLHFESKETPWKGGVYLVVTSPSKFYDFLITGTEKDIYMEFDTADYTSTVKFKNSPENEYLFGYRNHLNGVSKSATELQEQLKTETDPAKVNAIRTKLGGLQKEVNADLRKRAAAKPEYFASKIMLANLEPELPETPPLLANGKPDSTYFYRTYKKHFFDHLDFGDERMIRTPFLESKLEKYFKNLVYQRTDSLKKETDYVLGLAAKNNDVYRYALWYLTNKYENTDIVGLDGTVVHLYENHYLKKGDWLDSTQRARFVERLAIMKPIETGKVMPALTLKDSEGKVYNLSDVKAKYTIVYFYSPTCGHCKDHAPALVKFQDENRSKGIEVWNISSDPERDLKEMNNFIKTYDTGRMANLYDPDRRYDFRSRYDVYSTPTLYILDDKKQIIAKRIPIEDLNGYLEHYEKNIKGK
jgi:peroxiredoxin